MNDLISRKALIEKICSTQINKTEGELLKMPPSYWEGVNDKQISIMDVITALEAQQADKWIPVSSGRLPEEKVNPFTGDYCEYECTADFGCGGLDIRYYKFGRGHWHENGDCLDKYVTAWRERPEPYDPLAEKIQKVLDREHDRISGKK